MLSDFRPLPRQTRPREMDNAGTMQEKQIPEVGVKNSLELIPIGP